VLEGEEEGKSMVWVGRVGVVRRSKIWRRGLRVMLEVPVTSNVVSSSKVDTEGRLGRRLREERSVVGRDDDRGS